MHIPLTKPYWGKEEERILVEAIRRSHGSGDGPYTKKLIVQLKKRTGSAHVIPVTSCTHGLELAMVALGIGVGDEVILPSFTMSSTANSVLLRGATPVFADIDPVSLCIDPSDIEKRIMKQTRGIIVVHYAGMACDMEKIISIARKHKLFVVEDSAHALGASYNGKALGTIGDIGVFSFHGTKNITCGEGGVVLTSNTDLAEKMTIYRANGTNREAFLAGIVDKYSWVGIGTSFLLSDLLASIVTVQLKKLPFINKKRTEIASVYTKAFAGYKKFMTVPKVTPGTMPNWHIYALVFKKKQHRDIFLLSMRKYGIDVAYHYVPLHSSTMGRKLASPASGGRSYLPVTDSIWERLVRLPIYPGLTKKELDFIISSAHRVLGTLNNE